MLFFFFAVITFQSIPRMDFTLTTVPHFGQHNGAFGRKPPSIAMNSCPQQGHLALLIPVTIALSLLCFTASDATGIVHSVLHQLAAGEHGHSSNEQLDRKFQKILFHITQSKMKSIILSMTSEIPWPSFSPVFCPDLTICSPSFPTVEGRFSPSVNFSRNSISFEFK